MAIKIPPHLFFSAYRRHAITVIILSQMLAALLAGVAAFFVIDYIKTDAITAFTIGLAVLVLVNMLFGLFVFTIISTPLRLLSQAIAHVSNDPVVTEPPELNSRKFERSGLKIMAQTIYELAAAPHQIKTDKTHIATPQQASAHILEQLPCGIIALSAAGEVLFANEQAPVKNTPNSSPVHSLIFEQNDTLEAWLADCEANKVRDTHSWQRVADRIPGEANRRIFDVVAQYKKDDPSGVAAVVVTFDRSAHYNTDQEDMDFIALAAHELRGPITVIRGYLDVIKQELGAQFDADQKDLFDKLHVSSERLAGYINNILNVSRYDRKQFTIHRNQEDLADILKSLIPDLALRASTQHRRLTFDVPADLPPIAADRTTIGEVIINLIDNAIKYSHENGEVTVAAALTKNDSVEITVHDNGIGIPESVVGGLFNKFYRSHRSKQTVGGTGLGLYICKAIVEAHGGSIWVRSREGEGSTFGFTIPTYQSVANTLQSGDNQNSDIVRRQEGWIKNHAMYRR